MKHEKKYTSKQAAKLYNHLVMLQAKEWAALGATVNSSFFEKKYNFNSDQIIKGLKSMGIDYDAIPTKGKWYEFWKDKTCLKIDHAISLIPTP